MTASQPSSRYAWPPFLLSLSDFTYLFVSSSLLLFSLSLFPSQARHAFYGSLLMGILAHHLTAAAGAEGLAASQQGEEGASGDGEAAAKEFNPFEVGWKVSAPLTTEPSRLTPL